MPNDAPARAERYSYTCQTMLLHVPDDAPARARRSHDDLIERKNQLDIHCIYLHNCLKDNFISMR